MSQSGFPSWALHQARRKAGILLATMTGFAILSASSTIALSASLAVEVSGESVNSVSFGSVPVNTTSPVQNVTLENTGGGTLLISGVGINGTYASRFSQSNNCGFSLAVGASCAVRLTFTPNTTGQRYATLNISTSARGGRKSVSLSGTGVAAAGPSANVAPSSLSFGNQPVGTPSGTLTATLANSGSAALSVSSIAVAGANAGDFAQSNSCGSSVAAGGSCTISVTFDPTASGSRTASVSISDNATAGSPQTIGLSGTGTVVAASLSPTSLSFGSEAVSTKSGTLTATLTNNGNAALSLSSIALTGANTGDFAETNTCGSSVAAGGSCTISVTFDPTTSGSRSASVSITDNATGSPQSLSLSGTGTTVAAGLSPTSLAFGSEAVSTASGTLTATLTNSGTAALSLSSIALAGANPGDFAETNTCGSSVAAGGSCTISVTFDPTTSGSRSASVSITDNATGSPQSLSLSGTGTAAAASLSPTSLSFGSQPIAITSSAQTVTLTNGGTTALSISSLTITGTNAADFAEVADTCGSSVAAGANCTIGVAFTPSISSPETASITVADNVTGSPQTVGLSGSGMHNVNLSWTPSSTSGVVGYNIYRGSTSGGESSTPLNSAPVGATAFTDEGVTAGSTYYYIVTAVGADDAQSSASGETSTAVPSN